MVTGAPVLTHPRGSYPSPPSLPLLPFVGASGACAALAGGFSEPGCVFGVGFGVALPWWEPPAHPTLGTSPCLHYTGPLVLQP